MERIKLEEVYKNRGYRATISVAYNTFLDNYKQIFRHVWLWMALLSLVIPFMYVNVFVLSGNMFSPMAEVLNVLLSCLVVPLFLMYYGRLSMFFNDKKYGWNIGRMVKLTLWALLLFSVVVLVVGGIVALAAMGIMPSGDETVQSVSPAVSQSAEKLALLKLIGIAYLLFFVMLLLLLPYTYVAMKYIAEPETHMRKLFFSQFGVGMRHWGYIFLTILVMYIIIMVVSFVISLPMMILFVVSFISASGTAYGDASGIPGYFPWLLYVIGAVTMFASLSIGIIMFFVEYYIYGSIEAREQERKSIAAATEEPALANQ